LLYLKIIKFIAVVNDYWSSFIPVNYHIFQVEVIISPSDVQPYEFYLYLKLSNRIVPTKCQMKFTATKLEIKMEKVDAYRWLALEGEPRILKRKLKTTWYLKIKLLDYINHQNVRY